MLAGVREHDDRVEAVARLGARLIMPQALEHEVTEFLGRERYQRAHDAGAIYRDGYEPKTASTTSDSERPRIRSVSGRRFESPVLATRWRARTGWRR